MAKPEGWVQEQFLRWKRYIPVIATGEVTDHVMPVRISLGVAEKRATDALGLEEAFVLKENFDPGREVKVLVQVFDLATGAAPLSVSGADLEANVTISAPQSGEGTVASAGTAAFCTVPGSYVDLLLTDVTEAGDLTLGVKVTVLPNGGSDFGTIVFPEIV